MNNIVCRICGGNIDDKLIVKEMMFGTRKNYTYHHCAHCEALQIENPIEDIDELYPKNYRSFSSAAGGIKGKIKRYLIRNSVRNEVEKNTLFSGICNMGEHLAARSLKNRIKNTTEILDVGCGTGELIEALSTIGFENVSGVDPYIEKEKSNTAWPIKKAFITDLDESKKYDVIMLHHSFEHMAKPLEILQKLSKLIKAEGFILIRIPVCDCIAFDRYKENWIQLDAPRHVFLHTNKSMELLAEKSGLIIDEIVNDSTAFGFLGSEQYQNNIAQNEPQSFFKPFYKKIFSKPFSSDQLHQFSKDATLANQQGRGDQRIYILRHP